MERIILIKCVEGSKDTTQHRSRRGMQKLSGKRNEFGRRSGEQLELYRRSNLSGKRTEADKKHF